MKHLENAGNKDDLRIVPPDPSIPFGLGNKVKLEYYSLEKTFEGSIMLLSDQAGEYGPAKMKKPVKMTETLSPLEQVIQKTDGQQIFEKNIFPQIFDDAAQEAYMESTETYTRLFEDANKYRTIMTALARAIFDELRSM